MKPTADQKLYPISRFQKVIALQEKYAIRKEVSNIPFLVTLAEDIDFDLLEKAVDEEIKRNDVLRVFGIRKDKELFQYFIPEYHIAKIKRLDFTGKTKEDQYKVLQKIADTPINYCKRESYTFVFVTAYDGKKGVFFVQNHMINDTAGILIVLNDLLDVYHAMKNGTEMPKPLGKFEDLLQKQLNLDPAKVEADKEFFREFHTNQGTPYFNAPFGDRMLMEFRKKKKDDTLNECPAVALFKSKTDIRRTYFTGDDYDAIVKTCTEFKISPQVFVYMLIRLQATRSSAVGQTSMFNSITSINRSTLVEKRTSGMALNNYGAHTNIPNDTALKDAYADVNKMFTSFYWHRNLPGTEIVMDLMDTIYPHKNPFYGYNSGTISVVPAGISGNTEVDYDVDWIPPSVLPSPMFTVVALDDNKKVMTIYSQYLKVFVREDEVDAMVAGYKKLVPLMAANPDKTLQEIIDLAK